MKTGDELSLTFIQYIGLQEGCRGVSGPVKCEGPDSAGNLNASGF